MTPFTVLHGVAAPMPVDNVDTDAITPMAAGRSTSVDHGAMLFNNLRYHPDGTENPGFVLNQPRFRQAQVLVAGRNFGCGSSRERAVWALMNFGIRCVIAPSFADIFHDNAFQNGLLPVVLPEAECAALAKHLGTANDARVTVDLGRGVVQALGRELPFQVSPERRLALLEGLDEIDLLLRMAPEMDAFEKRDRAERPWVYTDA